MKKIIVILFSCLIFYACNKSGNSHQYTLPAVSYILHNNFRNQVYDHSHSSFYAQLPTIQDHRIYWDSNMAIGSTFACEAWHVEDYKGDNFYQVHLYDSATGEYVDTRSILIFTIPSIKSFTNHNDTSVLINIRDTSYGGHAMVSVDITSMDSGKYSAPSPTISGRFNISGTVSNGYFADSVSFSSSGTFANLTLIE